MAIVTISRELGSWGTRVAATLSERLGCRLMDKGNVEEHMREYGISSDTVNVYYEKRPGFWDRISSDKTRYEHLLRGSILESARAGNCVILGRGGQVVLATIPGVTNVRVTAPWDARIERIMQRLDCSEEQAARRLRQNDQNRSGFHRFFFGTNWASPELYDMVVNTAQLSVEQVVQGILALAPQGGVGADNVAQQRLLIDRCLEMRVLTQLIYRERMMISALQVVAKSGVVTLRGDVLYESVIGEVTAAVRQLEDVEEVDNQLVYKPLYLPHLDYYC
jgi:cytidylate kinase